MLNFSVLFVKESIKVKEYVRRIEDFLQGMSPMTHHVRLLVGLSVHFVGRSVIISHQRTC